jgi:DNA (cytosine-5)-methyltransferase 1
LNAVEIFGGAGGLALGVAQAGFDHLALVDVDPWACETIKENQRRGHALAKKWPLHEVDIRKFDYASITHEIDLLTAGLPCQPFSFAGKGKGHKDKRDMFSEVVRAARELRPKAILMENVRGLVRSAFKEYFEYLLLAIASPGLARAPHETWRSHFDSLQRDASTDNLKYDVHVHTVNAADYGVPQWRDRVLIVAFRSDLGVKWSLPPATHGIDALLWAQLRSGEYWKHHGLDRRRPSRMSRRMASRVEIVRALTRRPEGVRPWRTVRDAVSDLPKLRQGQREDKVLNHLVNRGARPYSGHDGSLIDEPAKTIKAGIHGVPGGENSLYLGRGRIRYFSVRECARLQTFPDDYFIAGPWSRAMRQVGNAVPVLLAKTMADQIRSHLESKRDRHSVSARAHVIPFRPPQHLRRAG